MSSQISPRTAKLGLVALQVAVRNAQPRRNGSPLPEDVREALAELENAAAIGGFLGTQGIPVPASRETISVAEAAKRIGISDRAVRDRIAAGKLPARRVGSRTWLVEWSEDVARKAG